MKELIDKYLNEAEQVKFTELDPDKQKSILKVIDASFVGQTYSGIHGDIVEIKKGASHAGRSGVVRLNKKDIKKLASDKNIRWIEVSTIAL